MSIDAQIAALIAALNANTQALEATMKAGGTSAGTSAPADKPAAKKDAAKGEPKITQDQVNAALIKIKDDFGMEHAKEVIKAFGKCDKMAEIKPATFQAVYDGAIAKHAELTDAAGAEDDGM